MDGDGRTYCTSHPTNVAAWAERPTPPGTYPYLCPSTPPTTAPSRWLLTPVTTTIFDAAGHTCCLPPTQVGDYHVVHLRRHRRAVLTTTDPRGQITTDCYYYESATGECAQGAPARRRWRADDLYSSTTPSHLRRPDRAK